MPRTGKKNIEHLNARVPKTEMEILRRYCEQTQRTQTDVIREFIRSLRQGTTLPEIPPSSLEQAGITEP